jgi:hypothetical protein
MYRTLNNETFTPNLVVGTVSTPGVLSAASATVTGVLSAGSAAVTGSAGVTGALTAGSAGVTGALTAGSAGVTGALSAGSAGVTGALTAGSASVTGTLTVANVSVTSNLTASNVSVTSLSVPNSITASANTTEFYFNTLTVPFVEATTVSASAGMTLPVYTAANKPSTGTVGQVISVSGTPATWNAATGVWANLGVTTGGQNTVLGDNALGQNTTGTLNTAIGVGALQLNQDGTNNTGFTNCSGLGNDARVSGSNQVQCGNSSTTFYGYGAYNARSDRRDKADIRDTVLGLEFVNKVRAVDFRWNYREDYSEGPNDGSKTRTRFHQGVIAQEVKGVMDELGVDFSGYQDHSVKGGCDVMTIGYSAFIGPLIKSIQELTARVALLESGGVAPAEVVEVAPEVVAEVVTVAAPEVVAEVVTVAAPEVVAEVVTVAPEEAPVAPEEVAEVVTVAPEEAPVALEVVAEAPVAPEV